MLPPPDGGPRGGIIPHRPGLRPTGSSEQRGPQPLMMQRIERPPGLGGLRFEGPRHEGPRRGQDEGPDEDRAPPSEERERGPNEPREMKLPSALEKVLAFKDVRAQEVGLTPEELENLNKPESKNLFNF